MAIANSVTELVGSTPLLRLSNMVGEESGDVIVKLEKYNPGGSVKTRIAWNMIKKAEESGQLKPGGTLVEPTSGNTGIGLALMGVAMGYKVILTMPDTMSIERRKLLKAYGAELILTPGSKGMPGAIDKAKELVEEKDNYVMPQQFENEANPDIHRKTTAQEILMDTDKKVDAFVAGVGTGGTITGVGEILKEEIENIKIVAVEPADSPVISGGEPGPHKIQGIGAGFNPEILNLEIIDDVKKVTFEEAVESARRMAQEEGLLVGISSGAAISAAIKVAQEMGPGKQVVVIAPDTGERYLSTELFEF